MDHGTSFRPGTRFGPRQIRQESAMLRPYNMATRAAPFESLQVADCGDVPINTFHLEKSVEIVTEWYSERVLGGARGCVPLTMGGDHTLTLPILRAMAAKHGKVTAPIPHPSCPLKLCLHFTPRLVYPAPFPLVPSNRVLNLAGLQVGLVHVDAHADVNEHMFGEQIAHGTPFRRAVEEGLLDCERVVQIGLRGTGYAAEVRSRSITAAALLSTRCRCHCRRCSCSSCCCCCAGCCSSCGCSQRAQ